VLADPSFASPVSDGSLTESSWERRVAQEVDNIVKSHRDGAGFRPHVDGEQDNVEVSAQSEWTIPPSLPTGQERPRPPKLEDTISNLRVLMDNIAMENVNSVANQDAVGSSYSSKKAQIESMLAVPQQAVIARTEQRQMCDHEVKALSELEGIVGKAIQRGREISELRTQQSNHYSDMTNTIRQLTKKNIDTLAQVSELLKKELEMERVTTGGFHFDPVALRSQPPEDMLHHASELTGNLQSLMESKLSHHNEALAKIQKAFACPECEEASKKLQQAASVVQSDLHEARERCAIQAESHRALDEADREKVLALKKDLEDIEAAERIHHAAEAALTEERKMAQHVAEKMVGFYQSLPAKKSDTIA
jgi:hypothetical protein